MLTVHSTVLTSTGVSQSANPAAQSHSRLSRPGPSHHQPPPPPLTITTGLALLPSTAAIVSPDTVDTLRTTIRALWRPCRLCWACKLCTPGLPRTLGHSRFLSHFHPFQASQAEAISRVPQLSVPFLCSAVLQLPRDTGPSCTSKRPPPPKSRRRHAAA